MNNKLCNDNETTTIKLAGYKNYNGCTSTNPKNYHQTVDKFNEYQNLEDSY